MRGPAYNESGSISWSRIGLTNRAPATYLFVRRKRLALGIIYRAASSAANKLYLSLADNSAKRPEPGYLLPARWSQ